MTGMTDMTSSKATLRRRIGTWVSALVVLPMAVVGLTLATSTTAHADDRVCRGTIGARVIDGNVVVPRGATCRLVGTRVEGNVLVRRNATLVAAKVRVDGNIQAAAAKRVVVRAKDGRRSLVEGNIQLRGGKRGGVIVSTVVNGDIQLFSNRGRFSVRRNVVDGNLQCKGNLPAPTGGANRVDGNKEGQCRRL